MKQNLLFPHGFRLLGWILFIPSALFGMTTILAPSMIPFREFLDSHQMLNKAIINVTMIMVIIGLLMIAFAREKEEDEMIQYLRLQSLQWSIYINYALLVIAILAFYNLNFLDVMIYNMFTVLLVFILHFRWTLYRNARSNAAL